MKIFDNEFFRDSNGQLSSKRFGFIVALVNVILMTWSTVVFFIIKSRFNELIELIDSGWIACGFFAGFVAVEMWKKK